MLKPASKNDATPADRPGGKLLPAASRSQRSIPAPDCRFGALNSRKRVIARGVAQSLLQSLPDIRGEKRGAS